MPPVRLKVRDVNAHVKCTICGGYLVDATAIIECLHAFCRTCIVRYLESSNYCPVCDVQVHKTKPLLSIRSDQTLQDVVYKVVPGLYQNEMQRRREFYSEHPEAASILDPEERGEGEPRFFYPKEAVSLSLQLRPKDPKPVDMTSLDSKDPTTRHLKCPAAFTVSHLKKFVHLKFSLPNTFAVDIFYDDHILKDSYSLMDVAYIYSWKRAEPMRFFYTVTKCVPRFGAEPPPAPSPISRLPEQPVDAVPEEDPEPMEVDLRPEEEDSRTEQRIGEPPTVPANSEPQSTPMDVTATSPRPHPLEPPVYNTVRVVSAPERSALLSPTNGFRLKFIHDPDKTKGGGGGTKKSGRKSGGRSSRHKSVPVRLAKLAPYPPPPQQQQPPCFTANAPRTVGTLVPFVTTALVSSTASHDVALHHNPLQTTFCNVVSSCHLSPCVAANSVPSPQTTVATSSTAGSASSCTTSAVPETMDPRELPGSTTAVVTPEKRDSLPSDSADGMEVSARTTCTDDHSLTPGDSPPSPSKETPKHEVEPSSPGGENSSSDPLPATSLEKEQPSSPDKVEATSSDPDNKVEAASSDPDNKVEAAKEATVSPKVADMSDDDLGCQPDLVVDERKMDEDSEEEEEDEALRKRIDAIARDEDEEPVTDDTEADSGRASDMSGPSARSGGEEETPAVSSSSNPTPTEDTGGTRKTGSIDHVIKQLYLQREMNSSPKRQGTTTPREESGVLDLSTHCGRKAGEEAGGATSRGRGRAVANPVLDLKHRQQSYLPAPASRPHQHTACPPAPKHPTSPSPFLHASSILQAQLTGGSKHGHNLHPPPLPYSMPVGRTFVSSTTTPSSYGSYKFAPGAAHQAFPSALLPYAASLMNYGGMTIPARPGGHAHPQKEATPPFRCHTPRQDHQQLKEATPPFGCHASKQQQQAKRLAEALSRPSGLSSPTTGAHPRASPSILRTSLSPHHRSASPAPHSVPSPASSSSNGKSVHRGVCGKSSEGGGSKFRKGPNLAVFNPDPNGFRQKLVIKNLDSSRSANSHH